MYQLKKILQNEEVVLAINFCFGFIMEQMHLPLSLFNSPVLFVFSVLIIL